MAEDSVVSFDTDGFEFQLLHQEQIEEWLIKIATSAKIDLGLLEYVFCSDDRLLEINKTYLQHDYYTDIITFPLQTDPLEATIFISIERVRENAHIYKSDFEDELHRVLAHGLLHLLGQMDKTDEQKKAMRNKEDECLAQRTFV